MIRMSLTRAQPGLFRLARGVSRGHGPVVLTRKGRDVAALVPLGMLRLAERAGGAWPDVADVAANLQDLEVGAAALTAAREEE